MEFTGAAAACRSNRVVRSNWLVGSPYIRALVDFELEIDNVSVCVSEFWRKEKSMRIRRRLSSWDN